MMQRLVDRLNWMSHEVYGELFALGQCMPGPTSTQVSFALGLIKKGVRGGAELRCVILGVVVGSMLPSLLVPIATHHAHCCMEQIGSKLHNLHHNQHCM